MASVCGLFMDIFWAFLRPGCSPIMTYFYSMCMDFCYADMLDYVLIYVDICVFRYIDIDGCKLYEVDIIMNDTEYKIWYVNVSYGIHYACDMI